MLSARRCTTEVWSSPPSFPTAVSVLKGPKIPGVAPSSWSRHRRRSAGTNPRRLHFWRRISGMRCMAVSGWSSRPKGRRRCTRPPNAAEFLTLFTMLRRSRSRCPRIPKPRGSPSDRRRRGQPRQWVSGGLTSWFNRFRPILVRWEKLAPPHTGMLHLVWGLIAWRATDLLG